MSFIQLQSGKTFDFLNPKPEDITIEDIANALSKLCRFTGHIDRFYSVAEHSVRVANMVPGAYQRAALMHDATEAFIGDMATPLKRLVPAYRDIEARVWEAVAKRFNLGEQACRTVKAADHQICVDEANAFGLDTTTWDYMPPANVKNVARLASTGGWSRTEAEFKFLARAKELNVI